MARRRRKKQDNTILFPVVLLALLGLGVSNSRSPIDLTIFFVFFLLSIGLIVGLLFLISKNRSELLSRSGIEQIDGMSGLEFEKYLQALLERRGYTNVRLTDTYDLGVDLVAQKNGKKWAIQAKRYKNAVGLDSVRQVVAAASHYKCDHAMVITNSYFTRNAQLIAKSSGCTLIDRSALISLILRENGSAVDTLTNIP